MSNSKLKAIFSEKCPRCRKGDIFVHSPISTKFSQTRKNCPVCGVQYEKEPSFFTAAMYISYVMSVGIMLFGGLIAYFLFNDPDSWVYIATVAVLTFLLLPFNFRYSRVFMLYLFSGIEYKEEIPLESK